jgi:hypothetical protein
MWSLGQEARAEAGHAKSDQVRMARDVSVMFDELEALADRHAELYADRARLEAELGHARQEAERLYHEQRAKLLRPWWERLLGN